LIFEVLCFAGLGVGLVVVVVQDIRFFRVPNYATFPLICGGILCALWHADATAAIIGAASGYAAMFMVEHLYRAIRGQDGLGRGDAKLFAAAGAWVGWSGLPLVLLIAAGSGLLVTIITGRRDTPIPFGPFLALGIVVALLARPLTSS
jgi:prepilin signal peptidase PulO-like enzyme (type II secretory pathway)